MGSIIMAWQIFERKEKRLTWESFYGEVTLMIFLVKLAYVVQ
jgi:hypothetical protein